MHLKYFLLIQNTVNCRTKQGHFQCIFRGTVLVVGLEWFAMHVLVCNWRSENNKYAYMLITDGIIFGGACFPVFVF